MIKPEQLKQKSQGPISQAGKIQMNTKVNNKKTGSAFKIPLRTKSLIWINKQCNAQGLEKNLRRTYSIESMDSNTDRVVVSLYLEEILNNCNVVDLNFFIAYLEKCSEINKTKLGNNIASNFSSSFKPRDLGVTFTRFFHRECNKNTQSLPSVRHA